MFLQSFRRSRPKAFTLVEVMVSFLVLALTSVAAFMALSSISMEETSTRDRQVAKNVMTSRFEQIRQDMTNNRNNFYAMNATSYPANGNWQAVNEPGYPAGFFENRIVFISGTTELKTFSIAVRWTPESGQQKQIDHVFTVARPPDTLAGNIEGTVTDCLSGNPLSGVSINISQGPSWQNTAVTTSNQAATLGRYDFSSITGTFALMPGNYSLTASKALYDPSTEGPITVNSNESTVHNFCIDPLAEAHIRGQAAACPGCSAGNQLLPNLWLYLRENGAIAGNTYINLTGQLIVGGHPNWGTGFDFKVVFPTGVTSRCFTLHTSEAWNTSMRACGRNCSTGAGSNNYNYRGWSSAQVNNEIYTPGAGYLNVACGNPFTGNSASDRLCVQPGDEINNMNLILDPVPTATVSGFVYNENSVGVPNATVSSYWHYDTGYSNVFASATTAADGSYQVVVPAAQELFANNANYYVRLRAVAYVSFPNVACCGQSQSVSRVAYQTVGPIYKDSATPDKDFTFASITPPGQVQCGNLQGMIGDYLTLGGVSGSTVNIGPNTASAATNGSGNYEVVCAAGSGYRLPQSNSYGYTISAPGYYTRTQSGSFPYKVGTLASVQANTFQTFDSSLLNQGMGTITVTVTDGTSPINDTTIQYYQYSGSLTSTYTLTATNVKTWSAVESWPPAGMTLDQNIFWTDQRKHKVIVSKPGYTSATIENVDVTRGQNTPLTATLVWTGIIM